ncbi:unnamed protein product, partial [Prorocentrum cordatum]
MAARLPLSALPRHGRRGSASQRCFPQLFARVALRQSGLWCVALWGALGGQLGRACSRGQHRPPIAHSSPIQASVPQPAQTRRASQPGASRLGDVLAVDSGPLPPPFISQRPDMCLTVLCPDTPGFPSRGPIASATCLPSIPGHRPPLCWPAPRRVLYTVRSSLADGGWGALACEDGPWRTGHGGLWKPRRPGAPGAPTTGRPGDIAATARSQRPAVAGEPGPTARGRRCRAARSGRQAPRARGSLVPGATPCAWPASSTPPPGARRARRVSVLLVPAGSARRGRARNLFYGRAEMEANSTRAAEGLQQLSPSSNGSSRGWRCVRRPFVTRRACPTSAVATFGQPVLWGNRSHSFRAASGVTGRGR